MLSYSMPVDPMSAVRQKKAKSDAAEQEAEARKAYPSMPSPEQVLEDARAFDAALRAVDEAKSSGDLDALRAAEQEVLYGLYPSMAPADRRAKIKARGIGRR